MTTIIIMKIIFIIIIIIIVFKKVRSENYCDFYHYHGLR